MELAIGDNTRHTGRLCPPPVLDVHVWTKGEGRHMFTIRSRQLFTDHVPGDCPIHVDNADGHRPGLLMQRVDKLVSCGNEAGFETEALESASDARSEEQISVQHHSQGWRPAHQFSHRWLPLPCLVNILARSPQFLSRRVVNPMLRSIPVCPDIGK